MRDWSADIRAALADTTQPQTSAELIARLAHVPDLGRFLPDNISSKLLRSAAVLVPVVVHKNHITILLTERAKHLRTHAGQVSFPGGAQENDDADLVATALRETHEEIGLTPEHIEIVGYLDPHITVSGFCVQPVVGIVTPGFTLTLDHTEVAAAFEVPVELVLTPENYQRTLRPINGVTLPLYSVQYQQWIIWGATAAMLRHFAKKMRIFDKESS